MASSRTLIQLSSAVSESRIGQLVEKLASATNREPEHVEAWDGMRMFSD